MSDGLDLGPDFVWGAATSAYQIEGAAGEDGRAPSIWDTFCQVPGAIDNGDSGAEACDHYHRWPRDIALMGELGLDAYRFSVAWPRVLPEGTGAVNQAGLDFYDRLVDGLLAAGIRPFTTLYHWDLPQALQDRGGWPSRDTAFAFAEFAAVVAARLGDRVSDWFTVNEPLCSAWIGHLEGWMAPGARDIALAVPAAHHLLLAHGLGAGAVRGAATAPARIGVVLNLSPCVPAGREERDTAAAWRADGHTNRWWLDPLHGRGYPADMLDVYQVEPPVRAGDLELIATPMEHLGLNYYFRQVVADDPAGPIPYARRVHVPGRRRPPAGSSSSARGAPWAWRSARGRRPAPAAPPGRRRACRRGTRARAAGPATTGWCDRPPARRRRCPAPRARRARPARCRGPPAPSSPPGARSRRSRGAR